MVYLNAGELDQRITLQEPPAGLDDLGQAEGDWTDLLTDISAKVDTRPGQEFFAAGQDHDTYPATFSIRYREGLHERMRVVWRERIYHLVGGPIDVKGQRVRIDLQCVAGKKVGQE